MSLLIERQGAYLRLLVRASPRGRKTFLKEATEEQLEAVAECVLNIQQFPERFMKCKPAFKFFKTLFNKKLFRVKEAKKDFVRYSDFISAAVATALSVHLNQKLTDVLPC